MSASNTKTKYNDISEMSFEQALFELESIVKMLETGKANLDEAISSYERGAALKQHCDKKLKDARLKVDKMMENEHGHLQAVATDVGDS